MSLNREYLSKLFSTGSGILSAIAIAVSVYAAFEYMSIRVSEMDTIQLKLAGISEEIVMAKRVMELEKVNVLSMRLASMKAEIGSIVKSAAVKTSSSHANTISRLPVLERQITYLRNELAELKEIISGNPSAALVLGALKKDIEVLKESDERLYRDMSSYATIGMWLIGILITVSLALFGFSLAAHFRSRA